MRIRTSMLLLSWFFMIGSIRGYDENDVWYERHTTGQADTEPPDVDYLNILFEATETLLSAKFQLDHTMAAYNSTNWTSLPEMKVLPKVFAETIKQLDNLNRTLRRKMDLGYHFVDKELADPIDRVSGDKLTDCFREMKLYVDRFQTEKTFQNKAVTKGITEMRLQINMAIQELENKIPELLEQMRILRNRVTESPY